MDNLELMTSSALMTLGLKLIMFIVGTVIIHALLAWMDKRSNGGFIAWANIVREEKLPHPMMVLGFYYCVRFASFFVWAAILFSS